MARLVRTKSVRKFQFDLSTDLWPFSCPKYLSDFVEIRWEQKLVLETARLRKLLINSIVTDHSWRFTRNARQNVLLGVGVTLKMERFFFSTSSRPLPLWRQAPTLSC